MTGFAGTTRSVDGWDDAGDVVVGRLHGLSRRLSPSSAALARIEAGVMVQFEAAMAAGATATGESATGQSAMAAAAPPATPAGRAFRSPARVVRLRSAFRAPARRLAAVGLAAGLALGSVAIAAAEAGPGQPFYRLRLEVETLALPAPGSVARLQADIDRVGSRLAEVAAAGRTGDVAAADDSAHAYADAILGILAADDSSPDTLAILFRQHEEYLLAAIQAASPTARSYVQQAVDAVRRAEDRVQANPRVVAPGPGGGINGPGMPDTNAAPAAAAGSTDDGDRTHGSDRTDRAHGDTADEDAARSDKPKGGRPDRHDAGGADPGKPDPGKPDPGKTWAGSNAGTRHDKPAARPDAVKPKVAHPDPKAPPPPNTAAKGSGPKGSPDVSDHKARPAKARPAHGGHPAKTGPGKHGKPPKPSPPAPEPPRGG